MTPDDALDDDSAAHRYGEDVAQKIDSLTKNLTAKTEQLEASKRLGPVVAATRRFFEIEGLDLGGLLALELFTTVVPLILIGYSYASDFSTELSFGDFMIKWMDLKGQSASLVQGLFGQSASLRSTWTFIGLAGFLFWGIPMSAQVAKTYARAFRRERWPFWTEVWRGTVWFFLLLAAYWATAGINRSFLGSNWHILFWLIALVPNFALWSISPFILIRHGAAGWRQLAWCGLAGVLLDTLGARITLRFVFPRLLTGWVGFGPIGGAMAMMTTAGVIAVLWVSTACLGAVLWERSAPADEVIASQRVVVPRDRVRD
jgi:hypothetical protein